MFASCCYLVAFLLLASPFASVQGADVLELTKDSFDDALLQNDFIVVEFFAPWCGHCKKLAPEYEKAAGILKAEKVPAALASVDATIEGELAQRYDVKGYPTLKMFHKGQMSDYQGPRDAAGIVKYVKKQAAPAVVELNTVAEADAFIGSSEFSIVAFIAADQSLLATFKGVGQSQREVYRFAATTNADVLAKYGHSDKVVVFQPARLHSKLEEKEFVFSGANNAGEMTEFFAKCITGLVGHMTQDTEDLFKAQARLPLLVTYFALDFVRDPSKAKYIRNRLLKVAKAHPEIKFAVANKNDFSGDVLDFDMKGEVVLAIFGAKSEKFKAPEADFSVEAVEEFIASFKAGTLENFIKSEPLPVTNDGPVKVVVGKNFDQIVNEEGKDVFIEFYAPWCGHCKSLAPKWEELGQALKGEDTIVIAKIDATANGYPSHFPVRGYPSLFWVPAGDKTHPRKYEGSRETADMLKYAKENSSHKLKDEL